jgi:hypothetical protein
MNTDSRHLAPRDTFPEMPMDVHQHQRIIALNECIYQHDSTHGPSSYLITSSGQVYETIKTASYQTQFVRTLAYKSCRPGDLLELAWQDYVSAASRYHAWLYVFDDQVPYISQSSELLLQTDRALFSTILSNVAHTAARWNHWTSEGNVLRMSEWPEIVSLVLACRNYSGISANYLLGSASIHWRRA